MSIRFVNTLDEAPKAPNLLAVGSRILFTMINGEPKPYEFIDGETGEHTSFGIPATA